MTSKCTLVGVFFVAVVMGCGPATGPAESNLNHTAQNQAISSVSVGQEPSVQDSTNENTKANNEAGYLDKLKNLYDSAKEKGMSSASAAAEMLNDSYQQVIESGSNTMQQSTDWANSAYQMLKEKGLTTANNSAEWLAGEYAKSTQWEYRIETVDKSTEACQSKLLEMGVERWECFQVQDSGNQWTLFCKRRPTSYLPQIPASEMLRLLRILKPGE